MLNCMWGFFFSYSLTLNFAYVSQNVAISQTIITHFRVGQPTNRFRWGQTKSQSWRKNETRRDREREKEVIGTLSECRKTSLSFMKPVLRPVNTRATDGRNKLHIVCTCENCIRHHQKWSTTYSSNSHLAGDIICVSDNLWRFFF